MIKIINNDDEHLEAIHQLIKLMDLNPEEGSDIANDLDNLAISIEAYEEKRYSFLFRTTFG